MNLAEINKERQEIITEGIDAILKRVERGKVYTAEELSDMSGGLIPAKNIQTSLRRGLKQVERFTYLRRAGEYFLFGGCRVKPVKAYRTLTYKVYNEDGELIDKFTRTKVFVKAEKL